ncbi:hypothetical protein K504DRAFT_490256 [Pleomassaria siparia CBS 279.74]|uniref:Mid2 domain-containing protein n=1 Tax=Pleomassaria siparia CBS 279.74 TaxID=1314801 RepID=A0A6G1KAY4_9PLEO|nr:hypothetical protein K504DRAFT_490256 [Pleomassaria siparia CBS 279.74]
MGLQRSQPSFFALLCLYIAILFPLVFGQTCYLPNGKATNDTDFAPCPQAGLETICCALNRTVTYGGDTINGNAREECMSNGLCSSLYISDGYTQQSYWRNLCTEQDWLSGNCLNFCAENKLGGTDSAGSQMVPCDGTATSKKWCCGVSCSCSDEANVHELPAILGGALAEDSSSSSILPTNNPSATKSPFSPLQSTNAGAGDSGPNTTRMGLSSGAKAGIGIAVAFAAISLVAMSFLLWKALAWKRETAAQNKAYKYPQHAPPVYYELPPALPTEVAAGKHHLPEMS